MSAQAKVGRLDHLGVIAGVIKDLGLIEFIDDRIPGDSREEISCGEAIAGMIINGLGFSDRPLTLTPQFFENKALDSLFRSGVNAESFNRFKLGRALDDCHAYGCDMLFAETSARICKSEGVDTRFNSLDTTAFALTGEYMADSDEHVIEITYGYSKDHRPDLKQAVLELMCTHNSSWLTPYFWDFDPVFFGDLMILRFKSKPFFYFHHHAFLLKKARSHYVYYTSWTVHQKDKEF